MGLDCDASDGSTGILNHLVEEPYHCRATEIKEGSASRRIPALRPEGEKTDQHEGRQRKSGETERSWVAETPARSVSSSTTELTCETNLW